MPRLSQASLNTVKSAPLGPGAVLCNVKDRTLNGFRAVLRKTAPAEETGFTLGAMTSVPAISFEPDVVNIMEDVQGANTVFKGAQQPQSYAISAEAEIVEVNDITIPVLMPGMTDVAWENGGTKATLDIGAGAAGVRYTANSAGTGGNSIRVAHVNPGNDGVLSVAVSGNDITVTLATSSTGVVTSTAAQARTAVNAHTGASALVSASLVGDGTGLAVVGALTSLTGGTAGLEVGRTYKLKGFFDDADYLDNVNFLYESTDSDIYIAITLFNCLNTGATEISGGEGGQASGVGVTLIPHATDADFDPDTGTTLPPAEINWLAPAQVVA